MSIVLKTTDPTTGKAVEIYQATVGTHKGQYAIGLSNGGFGTNGWSYLSANLEWLPTATFYLTENDAKLVWECYELQAKSQKGESLMPTMKIVKYKFLLEFNHPFHIYMNDDNKWRVGVENIKDGGYHYLQQDLEFGKRNETANLPNFGSQAIAEQICDEYLVKVKKITATPILIDQSRAICKFNCPSCRATHTRYFQKEWESVYPAIRIMCPRNLSNVLVHLWNPVDPKFKRANKRSPTAPIGDITRLPKWDCKECYGTGEFIGLGLVDPCSTCFPKNS